MKEFSNTEMLFGLLRNDRKAIAGIAGLTLPELINKVKYLRTGCVVKGEPDSAIANVSFKKQLSKYRKEAIRKIWYYETNFNDDTILKRCLRDVFTIDVIWLCLENKIKINISKIYFKFKDFREKRKLEVDNIFRLISIDTMDALKNILVNKPRKRHSNGLLFIICRNKVTDYINEGIDEVETKIDNATTPMAEEPDSLNWETLCVDFLEKFLTKDEFEEYLRKTNEKYEIIADALQHRVGLSASERKILTFKLVSGESHQEISKMLGLDAKTSKTLLSRAMQKIRIFLKDEEIGLNYQ